MLHVNTFAQKEVYKQTNLHQLFALLAPPLNDLLLSLLLLVRVDGDVQLLVTRAADQVSHLCRVLMGNDIWYVNDGEQHRTLCIPEESTVSEETRKLIS